MSVEQMVKALYLNSQKKEDTTTYEGGTILINAFIEEWIQTKRDTDNITQKTYENYESRYNNHIKPFFTGMYLTDIAYSTVTAFIKTLVDKTTISTQTVHDIVRVLSIALNDAVVRELIPKDPVQHVPLPKIRIKKEVPSITVDEVRKLYAVNKKHHYSIAIPILAQTGMRKGELLALTWDDLQYNEITNTWGLTINKKVSASKDNHIEHFTKTQEGMRTIIIPPALAELMLQFKEEQQKNAKTYVISQKRQNKREDYRNFHRTMDAWIKKAGIREDLSTHSFRHAFATQLFIQHVPFDAIKQQGGWSDDAMPRHYTCEAQTAVLKVEGAEAIGKIYDGVF